MSNIIHSEVPIGCKCIGRQRRSVENITAVRQMDDCLNTRTKMDGWQAYVGFTP